ncbi:cbb3-type cytochrome c oxidase subunit III [Neolewinella xylanilytica]|uniref:Cbb3-type cytochrome c oxidase subunit III n=1 Tax=Neolewinella xylanilytica TaxID=1514080 RepID=A0A2S6IBD8_9BACT|nr:c-type cytochrome [Neolewinella xylanilytica]PPK88808.1 cbb3-type cytochrome c oxidase subunit III [Neolewinella xylanilytica]
MKRLFPLLLFAFIILACGGGEETASEAPAESPAVAAAPDIDTDRIWKVRCIACHGLNGDMGTNGAANLQVATSDLDYRINIITNGSENGVMTAFKDILTPEEIEAMARHTMQFNEDL